jgi:curved DNA-binding protein CbpA
MPSPYDTLQVARNAEPEVIAAAYRSLARKYHPDRNASAASNQRMQDINAAYEILKDPRKRRKYDRENPAGAGQIYWRGADAIDWYSPSDPEDDAEWATSYAARRRKPKPIRRPGFWERNWGVVLYVLVAVYICIRVLAALAGYG